MADSGASSLCLVGDIGGTNARFALADLTSSLPRLIDPEVYACADFPSAEAAALAYLTSRDALGRAGAAVLAVAGPVADRAIAFTNMSWVISEEHFGEAARAHTTLINDYAALARAAPLLGPSDLTSIGPERPRPERRTIAVIGPGTGFGASALVWDGDTQAVLTTEGGHIAFAPSDEVEARILTILDRRFGRTSVERILSGPGLLNLHEAMCEIDGRPPTLDSPTAVTNAANSGDPLAIRTVERFCAILGSVAGDLVLAYGAQGGLLLAGGVTARVLPTLQSGGFRARFEDKGRFQAYAQAVPTHAIRLPHHAALLGAASVARSQVQVRY